MLYGDAGSVNAPHHRHKNLETNYNQKRLTMSLSLQSWAQGLSPRSKAIARDINESGIVVQRGMILSYCIALLKADLGVQAVGRV